MESEEALAGKDHHTRDHVICHQHPLSILSIPQIPSPNQPTNQTKSREFPLRAVRLRSGCDADALASSLVRSRRACLCAMHFVRSIHPEMSKPNPTLSAPTGFGLIPTHISSLRLQESRSGRRPSLHPPKGQKSQWPSGIGNPKFGRPRRKPENGIFSSEDGCAGQQQLQPGGVVHLCGRRRESRGRHARPDSTPAVRHSVVTHQTPEPTTGPRRYLHGRGPRSGPHAAVFSTDHVCTGPWTVPTRTSNPPPPTTSRNRDANPPRRNCSTVHRFGRPRDVAPTFQPL